MRDKIGLREKILSSNFTDYENYNFPIDGICTITNCSYDQFSLRLSKILTIDTKAYFENLNQNEVMMYDEDNNMLDKVRLKINENLKNKFILITKRGEMLNKNIWRGRHGPLLIAEIGGNHEGNFNYAKKLVN